MVRRSRVEPGGARPSARDVVQVSLMRIRQYGGLSVENMDTYGEPIKRLRAVTFEVDGIDGGRTDAAINVVRCAIANLVMDEVHYNLLSHTLVTVDRSKRLPDRERESHPHLYDLSQNQVEHWRDAAYLDLASQLVRLKQTPCTVRNAAQINDLLAHMEAYMDGLERILLGMGIAIEPGIRRRSATRVWLEFPRGASKTSADSTIERRAMLLIQAGLVRLGRRPRDDSPEDHDFFWRYAFLSAYYKVDPESTVIDNVLREDNAEEIIADAFRLLARAMQEEEYDDWPSIGGEGNAEVGVPVPST